MDAGAFRDELHRQGALASLIERYTLAFFSQVSQQVACNGLHSVEQRCARWLLLTHDRVGTDEFPMTHEFLSQMLGVRRASVTVTAGSCSGPVSSSSRGGGSPSSTGQASRARRASATP